MKLKMQNLKERLEDLLQDIRSIPWVIRRNYKAFKRACAFFKHGWGSYDWDHSYIHSLLLFKLKRMEYEFINHGHHSEECGNYKPKMKSLRLCIKLLERLCKNDYTRFTDMHSKKWGKLDIKWEDAEVDEVFGKCYRSIFSRPNAITPEQIEQEKAEFSLAYSADDREEQRDLRLIHNILAKYCNYWWD